VIQKFEKTRFQSSISEIDFVAIAVPFKRNGPDFLEIALPFNLICSVKKSCFYKKMYNISAMEQ
jgi:hypothetical protein